MVRFALGSHLLLQVPDKEKTLEGWSDDALLGRLDVLRGEYSTRLQLNQIKMFRENGCDEAVREIAGKVRARLFDLSAFMKELKMKMTGAYNIAHGRRGTLWDCSAIRWLQFLRSTNRRAPKGIRAL